MNVRILKVPPIVIILNAINDSYTEIWFRKEEKKEKFN